MPIFSELLTRFFGKNYKNLKSQGCFVTNGSEITGHPHVRKFIQTQTLQLSQILTQN